MGLFIFLLLALITFLWLFFKWTNDEAFIKILLLFMIIWAAYLLITYVPIGLVNFFK